ncbi:MAG TPA: hypothetical protein VHR37_04330 [Solirubrobacterales bacterium]|jgi:hypothetical protein|nr:hypothetical protein [Solirubrobacterales bacterium]
MAEAEAGSPPAERADSERRPAFYALSPGGWRDVLTILHPPYTAWHLSYVALGAAAATAFHPVRLWAALGAFFLAVGVAAHALDELHGHPLGTRISDRALAVAAGIALAGAVGIGIAGLFVVSWTLLPFVVAGALAVLAYNLELFGGRFHNDFWFAAAWGAFPALTGFWSNALGIHSAEEAVAGVAVTVACFWLSVAQRRLSTPARELRRRTVAVGGLQRLADGTERELTPERLSAPLDGALKALSTAVVLLAVAAVAIRL